MTTGERAGMSAAAGLCFRTRFDLRSGVEHLVRLFEEANQLATNPTEAR